MGDKQRNPNHCKNCDRHIQGQDYIRLKSIGLCQQCYWSTPSGFAEYRQFEDNARKMFGPNWKTILAGYGDQ